VASVWTRQQLSLVSCSAVCLPASHKPVSCPLPSIFGTRSQHVSITVCLWIHVS
jgi:hypothetical protein